MLNPQKPFGIPLPPNYRQPPQLTPQQPSDLPYGYWNDIGGPTGLHA
jgi:hypothetical protein